MLFFPIIIFNSMISFCSKLFMYIPVSVALYMHLHFVFSFLSFFFSLGILSCSDLLCDV